LRLAVPSRLPAAAADAEIPWGVALPAETSSGDGFRADTALSGVPGPVPRGTDRPDVPADGVPNREGWSGWWRSESGFTWDADKWIDFILYRYRANTIPQDRVSAM